jgi:hypothetical protein
MTELKIPQQSLRWTRSQVRRRRALYLAYGSNLSMAQMDQRCPGADPIGPVLVGPMSLVFRGVADAVHRPGGKLAGGLWRISDENELTLDRLEGVRSRFYLKRYFTVLVDGRPEDALLYQLNMTRGVMPPSEEYLGMIVQGYHDFGLKLKYLDRALAESWNDKKVTWRLQQRHDNRGRPKLAKKRRRQEFVLTEDELRQAGARP